MRTGTTAVAGLVAATLMVVVAVGADQRPAAACSCAAAGDYGERLRAADAVFVGELTEIRDPRGTGSSAAPARYLFEVAAVYKGEVYEVQSVVTPRDGASCGMDLTVGGPYLIFGRVDALGGIDGMRDGELFSDLCSGNRATDAPEVVSQVLEPLPGSSPVGSYTRFFGIQPRWFVLGGAGLVAAVAVVVRGRRARRSLAP